MEFEQMIGIQNMCPVDHEPYCVTNQSIEMFYQYGFLSWLLYLYCSYLHEHFTKIWNCHEYMSDDEDDEFGQSSHEEDENEKVVNIEYTGYDNYSIKSMQK